jgi:hypothetical protein
LRTIPGSAPSEDDAPNAKRISARKYLKVRSGLSPTKSSTPPRTTTMNTNEVAQRVAIRPSSAPIVEAPKCPVV